MRYFWEIKVYWGVNVFTFSRVVQNVLLLLMVKYPGQLSQQVVVNSLTDEA